MTTDTTNSELTSDNETAVPAPLLEISDLRVDFRSRGRDVPAVRGVGLTVYPGQTVAIVGESGSGKSTTAAAVLGLLPGNGTVTGGKILFDGKDLAQASRREFEKVRGSGIGLVPQDPNTNLDPVWRVGFQVRETLVANGAAKRGEARTRAVEVLRQAGLRDPEKRAAQYPHEFSGGMKQRALIAIGLAGKPKLLIADEPTSALDVTVQREILDHLATLTDELGTAVLLITHDLGLAAERASHLVVMYRGRIVESGPAQEILTNPHHEYTKRLVDAAPSLSSRRADRHKPAAPQAEPTPQAEPASNPLVEPASQPLVEPAASEPSSRVETTPAQAEPNPLVEPAASEASSRVETTPTEVVVAANLVKDFPIRGSVPFRKATPFRAVDDVSFTLNRGTTTAVVGESGSGKSTVARMVLGLLEPTSGTVHFDGSDVTSLKGAQAKSFRRRVQPVFQNPYGSLDPMYSIYRAISEPLVVHNIGDKASRIARVRELLDLVALPSSVMQRFPNELSGGQRQRVAIARALALNPEVVVCDEAVSALDVLVQEQILTLLDDLQHELDLTYLFITHDLAVVRQIADRVLVMRKGKVVDEGTVDDVYENPTSDYTRELLAAIPGRNLELQQ
ncbi:MULTISPECIES: dipeptide ABC transporter ATP-binding protein [unclassified Gordonia (in: high G+C Gram-positive bacteria)]|uniref:dipeptide ABC transporter ATP-binding protein n=1 Tax=unclassified Gordonia (in: high G+C Gram-positive bacteria) TaxID=2657482 RepID=UPI0007EAA7ED|nr:MULTISPECIES: ABC transporter ATP-binding protein [unclassified Gordonia (in: high G+C Gram-positive bacteria)]OBC10583.1 ABC transporter ATP-binding protein [Gordonia sp. 852002-50395_SCH5434458]OBC11321.1 ABC transporter ATP-binding protein [Gordonia sp. 852002-50816_SCH5313054-c]OBC19874.1 ABC transporter ATP-binding protein [Gordonia sp. 852002-50816_SCH5313054-a]